MRFFYQMCGFTYPPLEGTGRGRVQMRFLAKFSGFFAVFATPNPPGYRVGVAFRCGFLLFSGFFAVFAPMPKPYFWGACGALSSLFSFFLVLTLFSLGTFKIFLGT